mmetsp:Transcript_6748/g.11315  ORF Transcript_6748/g.11315 Transcript_6748/m.11315 type:complete len:208 (+) Transcript_6748:959-1582(+)
MAQSLERAITNENVEKLLDLTYEKNYDMMKEMEESEPRKLDRLLASHFASKFLLDILQFAFAYFVKAQPFFSETEEERLKRRELYDHRSLLDEVVDGRDSSLLRLEMITPNFKSLLKSVVETLGKIWTSPQNILKIWCIKFADDPQLSRTLDLEKDSYERTDNYDGQGVAIYAYLHLKEQIDHLFSPETLEPLVEMKAGSSLAFAQY